MNPASTTPPATMLATSTPSTIRCALAPGISWCTSRKTRAVPSASMTATAYAPWPRESGPLSSTVGVTGRAQELHPEAHRMRPRSLGDPPSGSRSPLQSPLRSDFHCDRYRLRSQARCALRLQARQSGQRIVSEVVPGGTAEGGCAGGNKYSSDVMDHCATRAHCANPASGGVLHSAALRCGRDSE